MNSKSIYLDESRTRIIHEALSQYTPSPDRLELKEKTVITFAGIPSSGKSTISKKIEEEYGGIKFRGDEVLKAIRGKGLVKTVSEGEQVKNKFMYTLLKNEQYKNKLMIFDRSIDREYKNFFQACEENNWSYFIIQIDITREEAKNRLKKRNSANLDKWIPNLNNWIKEHEVFKKNVKAHVSLRGENTNLEKLFYEIDKLSTLTHK